MSSDEKAQKVAEVFHSVASKYDIMNDLMSFGIHRLWKRFAINMSGVRRGQHVLDIAGGTGDLAKVFSREVGPTGHVVLSDINESMLNVGRDRLIDAGCTNVDFVLANAETLEPFADNSFDLVTISFGLRNVTDKDAALAAMYRVLKPGGRLLILEFSKPVLSHSQNCMTCIHSPLYQSWAKSWQMIQKAINTWLNQSVCIQTSVL